MVVVVNFCYNEKRNAYSFKKDKNVFRSVNCSLDDKVNTIIEMERIAIALIHERRAN